MEPLSALVYILSFLIVGVYLFQKWAYSYWKRRGVYYIEPKFPYGNAKPIVKREEFFGDTFSKFYKHFKSLGLKGGGIYTILKPTFVPVDLELIKNVLQKDFNHFRNHGRYANKKVDPLSGHLFNLENEEWNNLRVKLTPTFTSAKMKMMFQTFVTCTAELINVIKESAIIKDPVDIKEIACRFTTDVIGSCAFGIDCNSLKNPNSEFRHFGKKIFEPEPTIRRRINGLLVMALHKDIVNALGIKQMSNDIESFFMGVVRNTVEYRERNNVRRKDFMQLLLELRNEDKGDDSDNLTGKQMKGGLTMNDLAAQCFVFFLAGFETSATTMTLALLELALNQDIQDKLRNEIQTVLKKYNGEVTYEGVMEMSYLDKVVNETLRMHSPAGGLGRVCNKEYHIPGTDIILEKGTTILVSVHGLHHDEEFYPEPHKFDPERFNEENKSKRPPCSFLAFGDGPRSCIGARFGLLQTKVGLLAIIRNYKVWLNEKTKLPIRYTPASIITSVHGGVWLDVAQVDSS